MKYRKKPVVIEAMQFDGQNHADLADFMGRAIRPTHATPGSITIGTLEGEMLARPGDWIIKGVKGEFYPCKPEIFSATYEAVP
jgi:hypothetical protein